MDVVIRTSVHMELPRWPVFAVCNRSQPVKFANEMSRQSSQDFLAATSAVHTQGRTLLLCVPRRENSSTLTNSFGTSTKMVLYVRKLNLKTYVLYRNRRMEEIINIDYGY